MRYHILTLGLAIGGLLALSTQAQDSAKAKLNPFRKKIDELKKSESPKTAFNDKPSAEQLKFFESKIRPVLIAECYKCHSPESDKIKGGLALDTREGIRVGGESGPSLVAGNPSKSLLIQVLTSNDDDRHMPPKKTLPDQTIADLRKWVEMGAPDPRDGKPIAKHEIDIEKGRQFWSFQQPKAVTPPAVQNVSWAKTDVDRFILAALEAKGLKPVADADLQTLGRRIYLDILGLPPTPTQIEAFVAAATKDKQAAIAALADELLKSPAYGERWGRHWLDVARFAESTGKSVNFNYPHAWRYRDYVIAAYNADKPFNRFVQEQLAGDLLPAKDDLAKAENLTATGFLAIGTKTLNERNRLQFEMDLIDEQIDAYSQAFLGVTAACARCHDHKFDPIPTKDYYALAGIFRSTETLYGTVRLIQAQHPSSLHTLPAVEQIPTGLPKLTEKERASIEKELKTYKDEIAEMQKKEGIQATFLSMGGVRRRIQIGMLEAKLDLYEKDGTPKRRAMGVRERYRSGDSPLYIRGEVDKPGETVKRGLLQVVSTNQPKITSGSGRKELAEWTASASNPLTARVYVNRVWLHLFGRGLVATPDNFGTTGSAPSNLALLDHLAIQFTKNGWSTKALIKQLVLSHTYQLSTKNDARNHDADPDNTLCWRMSPGRLDAETIRDAMLAISGNLDTQAPQGSSVSRGGEGYAAAQQRGGFFAARTDETHRSVYLPIIRDNLPESLALFDAADPSLVVGDRSNTTVPSQALFLMNNPFVIKQAESAAEKLAKLPNDNARVTEAYRLFYGRPPTVRELESAESFVSKYTASKRSKKDAWAAFCQALFGSAEFLMRN